MKALPSAPLKTTQDSVTEAIEKHRRDNPDSQISPLERARKDVGRVAEGAGDAIREVSQKGFGGVGVQVGPFYGEVNLDKDGLKPDGGLKSSIPLGQLGPVGLEVERKSPLDKPSQVTLNGTAGPITAKGGFNTDGDLVGGIERKKQGQFGIGIPGLKLYLKGGLKD
jgi:hypothetical protein